MLHDPDDIKRRKTTQRALFGIRCCMYVLFGCVVYALIQYLDTL